MLASMDAYIIM